MRIVPSVPVKEINVEAIRELLTLTFLIVTSTSAPEAALILIAADIFALIPPSSLELISVKSAEVVT